MSDISPSGVPGDEHFYRYLMEQKRAAATSAATLTAGKATLSQTALMTWLIEVADNKDYPVLINSPYALTINSITTKSSTGTCTLTGKIGATALGGTANSVSTSEQEQTHSSDNVMAAGDDFTLTVSSNAGAENVSVTVKATITLAAS